MHSSDFTTFRFGVRNGEAWLNRDFIKNLDPLLRADLDSEWYMGATNINGVTGNGRLTAGISYWGELTVLRWPRLSHFDHLRYRTVHGFPLRNYNVRMGPDSPSESYARLGRPIAVRPDNGSFAGVYDPEEMKISWFHEPAWDAAQRYEPEFSNIVLSTFHNLRIGITVIAVDFVPPDRDILVRRFVLRSEKKALESQSSKHLQFLYYANLAPTKARARFYPADWRLQEMKSDFLCLYSEEANAVVHFKPDGVQKRSARGLARDLSRQPEKIADFVDHLDEHFPRGGIYVVWGFDRKITSFSVGKTSLGTRTTYTHNPYFEARSGSLSMRPVSSFPACAILSCPVEFDDNHEFSLTVIFSIADKAHKAIESFARSVEEGYEKLYEKTAEHWRKRSSSIIVPDVDDEVCKNLAKRSILALDVGTDKTSGAIVASISRQPQYCFDWPRDGAFFDYALDLSSSSERVTKHTYFYSSVQIKSSRSRKKFGNFWGNYYVDGEKGSFMILEIDETALCAWNLWRHARHIPVGERDFYLERTYPAIKNAAQALMMKRTGKGGFPAKSREDDNLFAKTRTLHGATSAYLGLVSAHQAGKQFGENESVLDSWISWAQEIREAIIQCFDDREGKFQNEGWRGGTWVIWPARILPFEDERIQSQAEHLLSSVEPFFMKETQGAAYASEKLVACALAFQKRQEMLERVKRCISIMAHEVCTPGTGHFGEVVLVGEFVPGEKVFQNRTSIPHLWEGTLFYLALSAAYNPEWFEREDKPFSW